MFDLARYWKTAPPTSQASSAIGVIMVEVQSDARRLQSNTFRGIEHPAPIKVKIVSGDL